MLYLVRKLDQSIIINNDIEIKVNFPCTPIIHRKEVHGKIAQENAHALEHDFLNDAIISDNK